MKKVLITDAVDKKAVSILVNAGLDVLYKPGMKRDEIEQVIGEYHGLIVRSDTKVTADFFPFMNNMQVIGRAGTGVDNIDADAASRKGVIVMNTPGGNTVSTAEHAFTLLLSMCRNIAQADKSVKDGKWDRKSFKGTEVIGKTIAVIGLGKIGKEVAIRAKAFGMKVVGYDPFLTTEQAAKFGIQMMTLEEIWPVADFITVHVPLDEKTENLLSAKTFPLCKDGVKIVNCARGGIVNETDLVEALNTGKVSAAALDVYTKEPPDFTHPVFSHPKVVTTPHLGASTDEAQEKVAIQIAEQMIEYFATGKITGGVNTAAIEAATDPELLPYIKLSERMGDLLSQLFPGRLSQIRVELYGEVPSQHTKTIVNALYLGILKKNFTEPLNLISAGFFAREMGLSEEVTLTGSGGDYANLITVTGTGEFGTKRLAGTVYSNREIKIVSVDDMRLELKPEGFLLFYKNTDKPGMLGKVSTLLATHGINIAGLSLGRVAPGGEALTIINLDEKIDAKIMGELSSIDGVNNIYAVKI